MALPHDNTGKVPDWFIKIYTSHTMKMARAYDHEYNIKSWPKLFRFLHRVLISRHCSACKFLRKQKREGKENAKLFSSRV